MPVSHVQHQRIALLAPALGWVVAAAGALAIFATYWDESWHTDVGRDSAWAAPHILLYGSVGVVGVAVASWGLRALLLTKSVRAVLGQRPLLAAGLGGLGALAAAPIDAAWHQGYGRDAVLWSPPHMLVVFASTALALGVLSGLPREAVGPRGAMGVLLVANAVAVVFEYEADVPQFSEKLYLPILIVAGLLVAWLGKLEVPTRLPVVTAVVGYAALRLVIAAGLLALGRSTPDLPISVLGLAAFDLPSRSSWRRCLTAAMATSALAWAASAAGLASEAPAAVAVTAVPILVLGLLVLLGSRGRQRSLVPAALALSAVGLLVGHPSPAQAHDPGQGKPLATVELTAVSDGDGTVTMTADVPDQCSGLSPVRVEARRAGETIGGALTRIDRCAFEGRVDSTTNGRWFVYVVFDDGDRRAEAWLPINVEEAGTITRSRHLYLPPVRTSSGTAWEVLAGGLIYAVGIGLLALGALAVRCRPVRTVGRPA